ncbi:hypothetical protein QN277_005832 [Acacia crassicarpa]|uniref:F-box domain-containing protein n=1 Tax=Acacia crassicarpa TaxID=499986 RepID=A0AAE1MEN3_9FABA|nr:hypothetical protein QN277_005832 [Acacia crassicarpa]
MKKIEINGAAPYLHDEIIICILSRLPVKSLMRFQCVCKHWKNLFKSPYFIADHLHHSHQNPSLIISRLFVRNIQRLLVIDCEMQFRYIQKAPPPIDSSQRYLFFHIIGSSNGLLCLQIRKSYGLPPSLLVWNPVTRDLREVPESRTNGYGCKFGFGFSPVVNDYKIAAINSSNDGRVCRVRVYSLSRNSWKEIEFGNLKDVICHELKVSANGAIFIDGLTWEKEKVIVSFDIAMEVFTLIPWPPISGTNASSGLTVYEDKLALLTVGEIRRRSSNVNLWVMEEDISSPIKRWNWIKKFTSSVYPWKFVLGTVWKNEIVLSRKRKYADSLYLFNVNTNEVKTFACRHRTPPNFLSYVESLVPIVNIHNIEES